MNRIVFAAAFAVGLATVAWIGFGFVGSSALALAMTVVIAAAYTLGAVELKRFRAVTSELASALANVPQPLTELGSWLERVPPALRNAVRLRIEGERVALPGPALTPYLVGLLVMLGMLGTFLGMVVTFQGTVFALEGSSDLNAIRSALAAPIRGLGLAFGTSVAGVATSAMLGLMSVISRRERAEVARQLDARIATALRPFSIAHQREETLKALQVQSLALPRLVDGLQLLMDGLERRSQQLDEQLLGQQALFHREAKASYGELAADVGQALKDSLVSSARAAGDTIRPVVETAMSQIAQESARMHQRQVDATQAQLDALSQRLQAAAGTVTDAWTGAVQHQEHSNASFVDRLDMALTGLTSSFDERSSALLLSVHEAATAQQARQAALDHQKLQDWTGALETMAASLQDQWRQVGEQSLARQQDVCSVLEKTAGDIAERANHQANETLGGITRLLAETEDLVRARAETEARWIELHGQRMDSVASTWRTELTALRDDEAARGHAAVERLGELQAATATHLATIGAALEAPMTRLLQTASEVPQAAAEVIAQLRQEMTGLSERDNIALHERAALTERLVALLDALQRGSGEQRAQIESLVASATAILDQAGERFSQTLQAQAGHAQDTAAQVAGSAIELASLGESFGHGIDLFRAANEKLIESLQRIEQSMNQSMARSDEQLAYYVAQAREVIDLSITSQQGIVEDLRRLRSEAVPVAEGAA